MKKLRWDKSYELGIPEIDIQHRILFNILRILVDAIEQKREYEIIEEIINEVSRYALYHAISEEKLLVFGTSETKEHIQEHDKFREDIAKFREIYDSKNDEEFGEMMALYLESWIVNHMTGIDRRDLLVK